MYFCDEKEKSQYSYNYYSNVKQESTFITNVINELPKINLKLPKINLIEYSELIFA